MSQERYDYNNKEKVLNALIECDFDDSKYLETYHREVSAIAGSETY